jgi:hypothetical protein
MKTAISFYDKVGFERIGVLKDYYSLYDAKFESFVFVKKLKISNLLKEDVYTEEKEKEKICIDIKAETNYTNLFLNKIWFYFKKLF